MKLDSLPVVPGTIHFEGLPDSSFKFIYETGILYWKQQPDVDSIWVQYRVYTSGELLSRSGYRYDSLLQYTVTGTPQTTAKKQNSFEPGKIQYSGSLERGLSMGNAQSAALQSNFNLQLSGWLPDSIEVQAVLSDNNLPIQPDGSTQKLNELDHVQIRFQKKNWALQLGDQDLNATNAYFLNFRKRLQGLAYTASQQFSAQTKAKTTVSGALAKGKFHRNILQPTEGNQGPYRLSGANNESYFFVLANTEQVFVDGKKMERGADLDYTINYNTAEISFMPRRPINRDSRIQVEFEYADRNYLNTNLYLQQDVEHGKKLKVGVAFYQNSDAANSPINQDLTVQQKQFLVKSPGQTPTAFFPSAIVDSTANKIRYEQLIIPGAIGADTIYRYSTDSSKTLYALSFTDLGPGNGNYIPEQNGLNRKVYRYAPPVDGSKQGRYEPVQVLVAPKLHRVASIQAAYHWREDHQLQTEFALSQFLANRLAAATAKAATAGRFRYQNRVKLHADWALASEIKGEYTGARFQTVERLRSVEFNRAWGLPLLSQSTGEQVLAFSSTLHKQQQAILQYQYTLLQRGAYYKGKGQQLIYSGTAKGWQYKADGQLNNYGAPDKRGWYWHPVLEVQKTLPHLSNLQLSVNYQAEENKSRQLSKDSLTAESFKYTNYSISVSNAADKANRYSINLYSRTNHRHEGSATRSPDKSYNLAVQADLYSNTNHQLNAQATYRQLRFLHKEHGPVEHTLLGRAAYQFRMLNGIAAGNAVYELGNGQEPRREATYFEVPAGQGGYTWKDYNGDGLQQLNEFEAARFSDQATYARIWLPSSEYIKAGYTAFQYHLLLDPSMAASKAKPNSLWRRISWNSSLETTSKNITGDKISVNPWRKTIADTALVSMHSVLINGLSFNRQSTLWGGEILHQKNSTKALLNYGIESTQQESLRIKARSRISKAISFELTWNKGAQSLQTQAFTNRNYTIVNHSLAPQLSLLQGTQLRLQAGFRYEEKQNIATGKNDKAVIRAIQFDCRYSVLQNSSVNSRISLHNIQFGGSTNTSLAYTMLDALLPGKNLLWQTEFIQRLSSGIEILLNYEGRKPAALTMVHTGRASVRAVF